MAWFSWIEHVVFGLFVVTLTHIWFKHGTQEMLRTIVVGLKKVPGVQTLIASILRNEVTKFVATTKLKKSSSTKRPIIPIPEKGIPADELLEEMKKLKEADINPYEKGAIFAYCYEIGGDHSRLEEAVWDMFEEKTGIPADKEHLIKEFRNAFLHENALNPMIFPSLRQMETEIVSMAASMLHGDEEVVGFLTSGGTESVLMAIKSYRDRARKLYPNIKEPNIVVPITIHPCMNKAGHYFNIKIIHAPVGSDQRVDVKAMEKLIDSNTILLAASAPQFPHGIVDDIEAVSNLAMRKGLPMHVDSCFGGFMLPWVEKLGYPVPKFDFRNPGVTSMSADSHKWGWCPKGSSLVLYRNADYRKYQIFSHAANWGLYGSPSMAGTRPAANIASTWATMRYMGQDGYTKMAKALMDVTNKMMEDINNTPGLHIVSKPHMNAFAVGSNSPEIDIQALADAMEKRGFMMERQMNPSCLHVSVAPHHINTHEGITTAFRECAQEVKGKQDLSKTGTAGMYGMMSNIPDKVILSDFIAEFFNEVYRTQ